MLDNTLVGCGSKGIREVAVAIYTASGRFPDRSPMNGRVDIDFRTKEFQLEIRFSHGGAG